MKSINKKLPAQLDDSLQIFVTECFKESMLDDSHYYSFSLTWKELNDTVSLIIKYRSDLHDEVREQFGALFAEYAKRAGVSNVYMLSDWHDIDLNKLARQLSKKGYAHLACSEGTVAFALNAEQALLRCEKVESKVKYDY